jgi:UDP-3-O-[3-hydroxymyristoyl] glucosamine N-acyltransferase
MADARFYDKAGPFSLGELAKVCGAVLAPGTDGAKQVDDVAPLDTAGPRHISFLADNKKYVEAFVACSAGACIVRSELVARAPAGTGLLLAADPYRAYAMVARAFYPDVVSYTGVSPQAFVDPSAIIGEDVSIEAGAMIGPAVTVGAGCRIGANAVLHRGVELGRDCVIGSNVTVSHAILGQRVVLYPGVCVGQDGFGYAMGPQGHLKVPQLGRVIIEDDVEIGANSTVDRGSGPDTIIGAGTKIDNLVQIGHNVQLGRGCVLVSQVGIAGSSHLGDGVILGGQVGVIGHLHIGSGARVAGQSGIIRDVEAGVTMGGSPAVPMIEWLRQTAELGRMVRKKGR